MAHFGTLVAKQSHCFDRN